MTLDPTIIANGLHHIAHLTGSVSGNSGSPSVYLQSPIQSGSQAAPSVANSAPGAVNCSTGYDCLPAWRWAGFGHNPGFNVNLGFGDVFDQIIDPIGQVLFWLANFWWSILMALTQVVASFDMVGTANFANTVNKTFSDIGNQLNSTGLIFGVALAGLFGAIWKAARGGHQRGVRAAIRVLLPLGILIAMTEAAAGHTNDATKTASGGTEITAATGSPAWVVQKLQTEVDVAGGWLATAVTPNNSNLTPKQANTRPPACTTYLSTLNQKGEAALASSSNSSVASAAFLPETVSYLWEQTYLPVWTSAQFGNSGLGDRVACHYLDMKESIQPQQQAAIGAVSGYPGNVDWAPVSNGRPGGAYGPLTNASQYTQDIYAWSMCTYTSKGWQSAADYVNLDVGGGTLWSSVAHQVCNEWWTQGAGIYNQHWDGSTSAGLPNCGGGTCNPFALTTGGKISGAVYGSSAATATATATTRSQEAFDFMTDFEGHNAGGMLMGGIVVNIVSLALVWAMAGLCLGVVIAGFAIFILSMLLPLLLLGMALASDHQHMVKRGLKMGVSMMAAKGVMMVLLGMLVLFINAVQNAWTIPPGEGSIGTAFLSVLPPVAGLAVLAMLAKRMLGISLMNPLSASRLGWSMAKEADRGWGGTAGALGSRLSGHRNPLVRSAFGGGLAAATGGALGAFEMERLLHRNGQKDGVTRGAGTEQNPAAMATNRRSGQRARKRSRGLGSEASSGPPIPGGRRNNAAAGVAAGTAGAVDAAAGAVPAGVAATGSQAAGPGTGASRNTAVIGPDGRVTWGTRAAILGQNLNKDALKGKLKGLPQSLTGRYKQLEQKHGRVGAALGVAGGVAAMGAGIAFAPSLALAAGYAGIKATHRLTDRSVQVGRHVNSLYGRATGVLDRQLGLVPNNADSLLPNNEDGLTGRLDNPSGGEPSTAIPTGAAPPTGAAASTAGSAGVGGPGPEELTSVHDATSYVEAMREMINDPTAAHSPEMARAYITAARDHLASGNQPAPRIDQQPRFIDSGTPAASPNLRDQGLAALATTQQPPPIPTAARSSQQYIEQQRGTYDDRGRWVKVVPNAPSTDGNIRAGRRQVPQGRGSQRTNPAQRRARPPLGATRNQPPTPRSPSPRVTDPQQGLPAPPEHGNSGGPP